MADDSGQNVQPIDPSNLIDLGSPVYKELTRWAERRYIVDMTTCTGTRYLVNPDHEDEGYDIHHVRPCPAHRVILLDDIEEEYRCVHNLKNEVLRPVVSAAVHASISGAEGDPEWESRTWREQAAYAQGLQMAERILSDHLNVLIDAMCGVATDA